MKRSWESIAIQTLAIGDSFYTCKTAKDMTAAAVYNKKRIRTEKYTAIDNGTHTKIQGLVKVTII